MYDHILKNGRLTDKVNGYNDTGMDIAVQEGVIVKIAPDIEGEAKNVIDLNGLAVSMPYLMTRFMAMGMTFADVLATVTTKPAELLGRQDQIGCLKEGAAADIAIFKMEKREVSFPDARGVVVNGDCMLVPTATMMEGEWAFNNIPFC